MYQYELLQYVTCYGIFGTCFDRDRVVNAVLNELCITAESLEENSRYVVTAAVDLMKEQHIPFPHLVASGGRSVLLHSICKCNFLEFPKYISAAALSKKLRKPLAGRTQSVP